MRTGYTVLRDSGGRSRASLSRGAFAERDALLAFGDQSLADFYEDDLHFDYLSHSQFSGLQPSFGSAPLVCVPDEYEPDVFLVPFRTRLAFRLYPFCVATWGTCIG